ncbi:MAG TPA: ABC transporter ATP-binding protein [Bacteroidia bacterium]|nr:ABC transporter ATP-binding protein [Bacteroidia bacterium]
MIKAESIFKSYSKLAVLKGVSLTINKGELISIVGASGAGKTTLLHILGTLDRLDKGGLEINGIEISKLSEKKLAAFRNKNIGFVFQFHHLLPEFTALENVCIPGFIAGTSKSKVEARAKELLSFLGLTDRIEHKPSELSGGEQQRVAVARALINNPSVILADEPSGNLDSATAKELHQLFFKLRKEFNQTFVIVTHNEELANMADRKLIMKDGIIDENPVGKTIIPDQPDRF